MFNEELFWYEFGDLLHNVVLFTIIIGQVGLVLWLIIRWVIKNGKFNWSPNFNITGGNNNAGNKTTPQTKGSLGPVEVDIKKHINIDKAEISNIKSDEVKTGKVKTQKNKLKSLRRK